MTQQGLRPCNPVPLRPVPRRQERTTQVLDAGRRFTEGRMDGVLRGDGLERRGRGGPPIGAARAVRPFGGQAAQPLEGHVCPGRPLMRCAAGVWTVRPVGSVAASASTPCGMGRLSRRAQTRTCHWESLQRGEVVPHHLVQHGPLRLPPPVRSPSLLHLLLPNSTSPGHALLSASQGLLVNPGRPGNSVRSRPSRFTLLGRMCPQCAPPAGIRTGRDGTKLDGAAERTDVRSRR
jgi:hypothetical protein